MAAARAYLICTTPRSGSSLLATGLGATNVAGTPAEWFEPKPLKDEIHFNTQYGIRQYREFLERIIAVSSTQNGVFGAKVHAFHTNTMLRKLEDHHDMAFSSLYEALERTFPGLRYIYLGRASATKQAVSLYRASMSGAWHGGKGLGDVPFFDHYGIKKCFVEVERSKAYWEGYFAAHNLTPLRLEYETFIADYEGTVRRVLRYLELDDTVRIDAPRLSRQADDLSLAWEQEFLTQEAHDPVMLSPRQVPWAPY